MKEFDDLKSLVNDLDLASDLTKVEKGQKTAGTRVRLAMQKIKVKAQEVRQSVLLARTPPTAILKGDVGKDGHVASPDD